MAKQVIQYSIFLGTPGDLEDERNEIEEVIKELNLGYGKQNNLNLELLKWETHSAPAISNTSVQNVINNDIGFDYDIFIGIIWKKFGTKTNEAESGTEEEFLNAIKRFENNENIQILFYFKNSTPKKMDEIDPEELIRIKKFKETLKEKNVFYWSFNEIEELKTNLRLHLPKRIESLKNVNISISSVNESFNDSSIISDEDNGFLDYLIEYENLFFSATQALNNISEGTSLIGEELNRKTEEITRITSSPNPNRQLILELFKRTSKILDNFTLKLKTETPIFYDSFKEGINTNLKYMNLMSEFNKEEYVENLRSTLLSSSKLKLTIPNAIDGISSMHNAVKSLPKIQSDLNISKRRLDLQMEDLITKLKSSYQLISEFIIELEYRLK